MKKIPLNFPLVLILISIMAPGCADKQPPEFGLFESHADIGECNLPGNFVFHPEKDLYSILGSGENIWFDSDQLHYAWVKTDRDFILRARIEFIGEGKNPHRKIGWMIRNSVDTSSAHVSGVIHGDGLTALQYRAVEGGDMDEIKSEVSGPDVIQLERRGDEYIFTVASNGSISETMELSEVILSREVFAGLFICSHDNSVAEKAKFSDVEIIYTGRRQAESFEEYLKKKPYETMKMMDTNQLIAWCIVPFDANDRTPLERAEMLNELGITKLAYDYRDKHLESFEEEIGVLKENAIDLSAVWLWIQDGEGQLLDPTSEFIVSTLEKTGSETALWVSFPDNFYAGLSDEEKFEKAVQTLGKLNLRLEKTGCSLALYNHGDWFGEPEIQVRIIEAIGSGNITMVYNFHHAHHQMDQFEDLFTLMKPYLSVLNLNGMTAGGPKIITIGEGEKELEMLRFVVESDFRGEIGILGHTDGEDIRLVLERNLAGLKKMKAQL